MKHKIELMDIIGDVKLNPLYKRSNSLLETLYFCTKAIVNAFNAGEVEMTADFLKYNKYIDINIITDVQDFLFSLGFSVSSIETDVNYKMHLRIRWHDPICILRLVGFVFDSIAIEDIFK